MMSINEHNTAQTVHGLYKLKPQLRTVSEFRLVGMQVTGS